MLVKLMRQKCILYGIFFCVVIGLMANEAMAAQPVIRIRFSGTIIDITYNSNGLATSFTVDDCSDSVEISIPNPNERMTDLLENVWEDGTCVSVVYDVANFLISITVHRISPRIIHQI